MENRAVVGRSRAGTTASSSRWSVALGLAVALASASAVAAQNVLPNGEFDTNVLSWITFEELEFGEP